MGNRRAFAQVEIKSVDDEMREFSGIATTINPDRQMDIVEPKGIQFKLPLPLLSKHDKTKPIGEVFAARVTSKGVEYSARIPKVTEPGLFKDRVDEAWQEIKYGVVRGVSIGFLPVSGETEPLKTGGYRFKKSTWIELSPVPVPANEEATIARIKSIVGDEDPATGDDLDIDGSQSGATDITARKGYLNSPKEQKVNVKEQIEALEKKRKELSEERTSLQTKAVGEGRTKDAQERERFDEITTELKSLDDELADLKVLEAELVKTAAPAQGKTAAAATQSRGGSGAIQVTDNRIVKNGLAMAQVMKQLFMAQGNYSQALALANANETLDPRVQQFFKAAVAAGTTSSSAWAGNLVQGASEVYADFAEYLRPRTIIGSFGNGGIPALRMVPFRTPLLSQTSGGAGYWVGEGSPKGLTKFDFGRTELTELKVANIAVLTEELLRRSSPSADGLVRDGLVAALAERMDIDFVDPDKAAAATSPASITNGIAPISSSGTDADAVRADLRALWAPFIAASNPPTSAVYLMSATTALALSLMMNALGQREFPDISVNGGTLGGIPVIASQYLANDGGSAGGIVVLANASDIYFADEGGFMVDLSREASLQMDSTPTDPPVAATVLVSLWQHNLVGFRAERVLNWARRRAVSVSWLDTVQWGQ